MHNILLTVSTKHVGKGQYKFYYVYLGCHGHEYLIVGLKSFPAISSNFGIIIYGIFWEHDNTFLNF